MVIRSLTKIFKVIQSIVNLIKKESMIMSYGLYFNLLIAHCIIVNTRKNYVLT